jgi:hypothetical protein
MSIELLRLGATEPFQLAPGKHATREEGLCAMEAVAWLAGLPHSDRPACTSEILAGYVRHLNDHMPDEERSRLVAFLPELIGTADPDLDHVLNAHLSWQAIHLFAPAALRALEYEEEALLLEEQHRPFEAQEAVGRILNSWYRPAELPPVHWALIRAHKSSMLARHFYLKRNEWNLGVCGDETYDSCASASAAAAFHAYRTGCQEAWDLALFVLEEALNIVRSR